MLSPGLNIIYYHAFFVFLKFPWLSYKREFSLWELLSSQEHKLPYVLTTATTKTLFTLEINTNKNNILKAYQ